MGCVFIAVVLVSSVANQNEEMRAAVELIVVASINDKEIM